MAHLPEGLSQWTDQVSTHFSHLSKPQVTVLALYSFGMTLAQSCGRSSVALALALLLDQPENTLRERLRDWCKDARDKHGAKRRELDVRTCFAPLLHWVLSWWAPDEPRLALALDATTLGQRFTVLAASVVCCGCAIPVAWVIVKAATPGTWRPHWCALLEQLRPRLPADWTVIVLTDRGLWARWLYRRIVAQGWHPFMRINEQGQFCPAGTSRWRALSRAAPRPDSQWCGPVACFVCPESRLACTLLARWEAGHEEAWLLLTDLCAADANALWYSMRAWIECAFKDTKRGGLHWEQTKMMDPERAARLWLALAVSLLWSVAIGGCGAACGRSASGFAALPRRHVARRWARSRRAAHHHSSSPPAKPRRELSLFRRGVLGILVLLIRGQPLPIPRLRSFGWPGDREKTYP